MTENHPEPKKKTEESIGYYKKDQTSRLTGLRNFLDKHWSKLLSTLYFGSLAADALITADSWSKGYGGEKNPATLDMMLKHGAYKGIPVVSFADALITMLTALTSYYVVKAIPELDKYPRIKRIFPSLWLIYRTVEHMNGALSWLKYR